MSTATTYSQPSDKPTLFESQVCTRCGGSGQYSYCSMYGSRCFKCGGRGRTMTKRGAAAQEHYRGLLCKRADEIQPGDKLQDLGVPGFVAGGWREVEKVEDNGSGCLNLICKDYRFMGLAKDSMHRVAATGEQKLQARKVALAYQETLTKAGQPRKR